jgi:hypothetical protein
MLLTTEFLCQCCGSGLMYGVDRRDQVAVDVDSISFALVQFLGGPGHLSTLNPARSEISCADAAHDLTNPSHGRYILADAHGARHSQHIGAMWARMASPIIQ